VQIKFIKCKAILVRTDFNDRKETDKCTLQSV